MYCGNNPLNRIDTNGMDSAPITDLQDLVEQSILDGGGIYHFRTDFSNAVNSSLKNGRIYNCGYTINSSVAPLKSIKYATVSDLLSNKTFTNNTGRVQNFVSSVKGDLAVKVDFASLHPANVRTYNGWTIVGELSTGETVNIHASTSMNGVPTLEIRGFILDHNVKIRY